MNVLDLSIINNKYKYNLNIKKHNNNNKIYHLEINILFDLIHKNNINIFI